MRQRHTGAQMANTITYTHNGVTHTLPGLVVRQVRTAEGRAMDEAAAKAASIPFPSRRTQMSMAVEHALQILARMYQLQRQAAYQRYMATQKKENLVA